MTNRAWPWLLLALFFSSGTAIAQKFSPSLPPPRESHRDLPGGFDLSNPQEVMAQRLRELQELHQLQDKVQELLKDPDFLRQMKNFSDPELQGLRDKMLKGEGLSQDRVWNQLLNQARAGKKLEERQFQFLKSWAAHGEKKLSSRESANITAKNDVAAVPTMPPSVPPNSATPPPSSAPPAEPTPSLLDRLEEDTTKWLMENFEEMSGDVLQSLAEMSNDGSAPLAEMLRSVPSDFSGINVRDNPFVAALGTGTFSRYLSNAGDFFQRQNGVWDKVGSLFRKTSAPSLPRIGGPSVALRTPSTAESEIFSPMLLLVLLFGLIVLFLCKRGFGSKGQGGSGADAEWHLGSWPVQPSAVSTRQDLVRAFEYLALLCFGPAAAACHHRHLAQQLADRDSANPCRRQSAEMLAWLYEQARYAPAGETLSQEQFSDARNALCSLAGVTTA